MRRAPNYIVVATSLTVREVSILDDLCKAQKRSRASFIRRAVRSEIRPFRFMVEP